MARRRKHGAEGEEGGEGTEMTAIEEQQEEQAQQMEAKREEEASNAETMKEQQEEAAKEAAKHADDLRKHRAMQNPTRPKQVLTVKGDLIDTKPTDLDDYEGAYVNSADGETYGLKMSGDDAFGHTHHLKNEEHYWSGTADEFKKLFEKQ